MSHTKTKVWGLGIFLYLLFSASYANTQDEDGIGQTIQIYTRFHSLIGKPSWLLIIRDIDNNQTIPYLFDISKGDNFWVVYTYSRNYLITVSNLQFAPYRNHPYTQKKINNFCQLESNGRIIRGRSLYITISGNLKPYQESYTCNVASYADANFTIVKPSDTDQ